MLRNEESKLTLGKLIVLYIVSVRFHVSGYYKKDPDLIYILIWTPANFEPFNFIDMEQKAFQYCTFKNCFLTPDRNYLKNILDFDVLLFNVVNLEDTQVPPQRVSTQKYCMFGVEPAGYHPISDIWNGFFNITFTYKLSSNVTLPCVVVQDENDNVIGPKIDMHWKQLSDMNETSDFVIAKLQKKHVAAAWIVSHCDTPYRMIYAKNLQSELAKYGHTLDIYGKCGTKTCPQGSYGVCGNIGNIKCPRTERMDECLALIESDYFFYLAFENSFGEDYVTEKLLHGLQQFSVPIVFGSANYTRFMPDGIYLNTNDLNPPQMAERMNGIIKDPNQYFQFFKWYDHYSFHFSGDTRYSREMCSLCSFLNNSVNKSSVIMDIAEWWNEGWPPLPEMSDQQNAVEKIVSDFLDILDPSD